MNECVTHLSFEIHLKIFRKLHPNWRSLCQCNAICLQTKRIFSFKYWRKNCVFSTNFAEEANSQHRWTTLIPCVNALFSHKMGIDKIHWDIFSAVFSCDRDYPPSVERGLKSLNECIIAVYSRNFRRDHHFVGTSLISDTTKCNFLAIFLHFTRIPLQSNG